MRRCAEFMLAQRIAPYNDVGCFETGNGGLSATCLFFQPENAQAGSPKR